MARATFLIKLLVLCVLLPGALGNTNSLNGSPCDNTVNGNVTSSTDVGGNIVVGCGNIVSNITSDGATVVTIEITGSDNVAEDDVIRDGDGEFTIVGNRNEVLNDEADYIDLDVANDNQITNTIVRDYGIYFLDAEANTMLDNDIGDYVHVKHSHANLIAHNIISTEGLNVDYSDNDTITGNIADYINLYKSNNNLIEDNVMDYYGIEFDNSNNNTVLDNVADYLQFSSDTSIAVESNHVAHGGIYIADDDGGTLIKDNQADYSLKVDYVSAGVVENNDADYSIFVNAQDRNYNYALSDWEYRKNSVVVENNTATTGNIDVGRLGNNSVIADNTVDELMVVVRRSYSDADFDNAPVVVMGNVAQDIKMKWNLQNVTVVDNVLGDIFLADVTNFTLSDVGNLGGNVNLRHKDNYLLNETESAPRACSFCLPASTTDCRPIIHCLPSSRIQSSPSIRRRRRRRRLRRLRRRRRRRRRLRPTPRFAHRA